MILSMFCIQMDFDICKLVIATEGKNKTKVIIIVNTVRFLIIRKIF